MATLRPIVVGSALLIALSTAHGSEPSGDPLALPGEAMPEAAATVTCDPYPQVSCTGSNPAFVSDVVQLAADTRDSLGPVLRLGPAWRFPVHITLLDPVPGGIPPRESINVVAEGTTLSIEAFLPSDDLDARAFIQRQFVTALLWEKFFAPGTTFTATTRIDVAPVWLTEGLREWLNDDSERNRAEIVKRAVLGGRAPTLAEVLGWTDLSTDRLLGLWQRAFSYYLVASLIDKPERRDQFQQWLASVTGTNPRPPDWLFPTEAGWQRELRDATDRSRSLVFTWDESAAELGASETIVLPAGKEGKETQLATIETLPTVPRSPQVDHAIQQKINQLTALQLRVHPGWQPVVQLYRFGLTALVRDNDPKQAAHYLHEAHLRRAAEVDFHQKLTDYMNWYEITQNMPVEASHFRAYFQTAQELDKAESDPEHPNPIRSDVLKVESKF